MGSTTIRLAVTTLLVVSACTSNDTADASATLSVTSDADSCVVSANGAASGRIAFEVENTGSEVTEFYLYAADGREVIGEVENIGPGLTRELVVDAAPGDYVTACKPGMVGDGIRAAFTVTDAES